MATKDKTLQAIVKLLKKEFAPSRLYLFGSRATKMATRESDYDFVMVLTRFRGDRMRLWEKCNELIRRECGVLADVFTYSEREFKALTSEFSSIPETAVNTGREIDLGSV